MANNITAAEIKKMVKSGGVLIGKERSLKSLKIGKIQKIFLCKNCPTQLEKDAQYYAGLSDAQVVKLDFQNDELGVICKKPFSISALGLLKGAK